MNLMKTVCLYVNSAASTALFNIQHSVRASWVAKKGFYPLRLLQESPLDPVDIILTVNNATGKSRLRTSEEALACHPGPGHDSGISIPMFETSKN